MPVLPSLESDHGSLDWNLIYPSPGTRQKWTPLTARALLRPAEKEKKAADAAAAIPVKDDKNSDQAVVAARGIQQPSTTSGLRVNASTIRARPLARSSSSRLVLPVGGARLSGSLIRWEWRTAMNRRSPSVGGRSRRSWRCARTPDLYQCRAPRWKLQAEKRGKKNIVRIKNTNK